MFCGKQKDLRETINGNNLKSFPAKSGNFDKIIPAKSGKNLVRKLN